MARILNIFVFLCVLIGMPSAAFAADKSACQICKPDEKRRAYSVRDKDSGDTYQVESQLYSLDGQDYSKDVLVKGFFEAGYQKHLWQNDTALVVRPKKSVVEEGEITLFSFFKGLFKKEPQAGASQSDPAGYFSGVPTSYKHVRGRDMSPYGEYLLRNKGMPKFDSVHRWGGKKKLRVSVCFKAGDCGKLAKETLSMDVLQQQVPYVSKLTQPVTGIEIAYIPPELDNVEDQAEIRIMFSGEEAFLPDNKFKTSRYISIDREISTASLPIADNVFFERNVQGAVRFTPHARAQAEGYLIPDHQNNLDYAVCYIWPYHQKEVLASLMNECLLRALGLPEMVSVQEVGLLGHWNKTYDPVSKRSVLDGPKVNEGLALYADEKMPWTRSGEDSKEAKEIVKAIENGSRKDLFKNYPPIPEQKVSQFDLAMLSMLYCVDIKPGMGRYEILDALYKSNNCFQFEGIKPLE